MNRNEELETLYAKARQIARDFIGPSFDEEDELTIRNATPMQAIEALEREYVRLKGLLILKEIKWRDN